MSRLDYIDFLRYLAEPIKRTQGSGSPLYAWHLSCVTWLEYQLPSNSFRIYSSFPLLIETPSN